MEHESKGDLDIYYDLEISLEEASIRTAKRIQVTHIKVCDRCKNNKLSFYSPCPDCKGKGTLQRKETIELKVPAGVQTGTRLRLAGQGNVSATGKVVGDLYVVIGVKDHERFERRGNNLYLSTQVSKEQLEKGAKIVVQSLNEESIELHIPKGTKDGALLRCKGIGLPLINSYERGDLYIRVNASLKLSGKDQRFSPPANFRGSQSSQSTDIVSSANSPNTNSRLRVFLCHSSNDKPAVRNLCERLIADGIEPWLDEESLLPGQDWQHEIPKAVRNSHVVIVCLSRSSINNSGYIQKEIKFALDIADEQPEGTIFLIPLRLEECDIPERLRRWQWVNFFDDRGYARLMLALRFRTKNLSLE